MLPVNESFQVLDLMHGSKKSSLGSSHVMRQWIAQFIPVVKPQSMLWWCCTSLSRPKIRKIVPTKKLMPMVLTLLRADSTVRMQISSKPVYRNWSHGLTWIQFR
ncbi:hypothetical protein NPIL_285241 [Nephila pilipes]|uniref:Uncharacterized protein n=1 Tax=Nephila pilipes TaxID=299642 RepID=A0A8X6N9Z2_NEPPI|nr:hypothetical protein NPIL_285241 [Nephila pilipes]